jgi:hypothetical protein
MASSLRRRPKPKPDQAEALAHRLFREAAAKQRCCQWCGKTKSDWHPHHVIYAQYLKHNHHPIYDTRNVLRLCINCHAKHHDGTPEKLPLSKLRDENIEYAVYLIGGYLAYDYLTTRYAGEDARLERALAEAA